MLRIRLRRVGKKGKPSYRIVVAEAAAPRDGAYLDWIGNYDPMVDPPAISLKEDRAAQWLGKGAQPSEAVKRILDKAGILERTTTAHSGVRTSVAGTVEETAVGEGAGQATGDERPDQPPADEAPTDETSGEAPTE